MTWKSMLKNALKDRIGIIKFITFLGLNLFFTIYISIQLPEVFFGLLFIMIGSYTIGSKIEFWNWLTIVDKQRDIINQQKELIDDQFLILDDMIDVIKKMGEGELDSKLFTFIHFNIDEWRKYSDSISKDNVLHFSNAAKKNQE